MERSEYERMAEVEDTMWWYRVLHEGLIEQIRRLQLEPGARLLDAGCGTGGLLRRLSLSASTLELVGLERDPVAMEIARDKARATVVHGSVNAMPFTDNHFDVVVSADVLCHSEVDEAAALAEFHRCLKREGSLMLNLPAYEWLRSNHDRRVHNVRRYTTGRVRRLAGEAGLRVGGLGYWNSLLFPAMLAHRLVARNSSESDIREFPGWQDRLLYATAAFERRLSQLGLRFPFGGSVWLQAVKP